jgi:ABC-2 type transport system permease protein
MSHVSREFVKLLFQKRTYFGWAGLFIIPFLVAVAVRFSHPGGGGRGGADVAEQVMQTFLRSNGVWLPFVALIALSSFLLPLLASMVGSNTIAGEAENNTLRTVLMQPVRRGALLTAKWFVANLYVAIGLLITLIAALVAGAAFFGLHPMQLFSGTLPTGPTVGAGHAIGLMVLAYLYILAGMAAVVSLAVLFSTRTNSSLTAVGAALVLVIIMLVLGQFTVFDFLKPYLIPSHFQAVQSFFVRPIDYGPIWKGLANFAVWTLGTTGIGYYIFRRKDILS